MDVNSDFSEVYANALTTSLTNDFYLTLSYIKIHLGCQHHQIELKYNNGNTLINYNCWTDIPVSIGTDNSQSSENKSYYYFNGDGDVHPENGNYNTYFGRLSTNIANINPNYVEFGDKFKVKYVKSTVEKK